MKKTVDTISASRQRKAKRRYFGAVLALTLCAALTCPALAAGSEIGRASCRERVFRAV